MAAMNEGPSFFMFFTSEINKVDMKICDAFMQAVEKSLSEKVLLRDRNSRVWRVKVVKVGNHWYFVDGWDKFASDNSLTTGDLLVFKYFSDGLFNVKIYGLSGTEKSADQSSMLGDHVEMHDKISESNNGVRVDDDNDDGINDDDDSDDDDYDPTRDDQKEDNEGMHDHINNDEARVSENAQDRLRYLYAKCYGMEIFEAGLAERPRNPYFVAKVMLKRQSNLFIPMDVIKDYNLDLKDEITLVDPSGREFHTKCKQWTNGRWVLSGGWINLCRVNHVSPEDSCICEFVQREGDQRQFLHVSFVRANV